MYHTTSDNIRLLTDFLSWFSGSYIEIIATITGLIYLIYSIEGKIQLWFYGLVTSLLYIFVFYRSGIYADMGINAYYVFISIYGWFHWKYGRANAKEKLPVSRIDQKSAWLLLLVSLVILVLIAYILIHFTNSSIPWADAFTTAFSITATWMLARKIMEHWIVWIVVDLVSAALYIYKGLYPTVFLFLIYTVMAVIGYIQWLRLWKDQEVKS